MIFTSPLIWLRWDLLPNGWAEQIESVADEFSYETFLDGRSSSSREDANFAGAVVSVVDGDVILRELPWLYQLYTKELLDLASSTTGNTHVIADRLQSSINIKCLGWDRCLLRVAFRHKTAHGYSLRHHPRTNDGGSWFLIIWIRASLASPESGKFILFDATGGSATM